MAYFLTDAWLTDLLYDWLTDLITDLLTDWSMTDLQSTDKTDRLTN